jgi:hypothetical protein
MDPERDERVDAFKRMNASEARTRRECFSNEMTPSIAQNAFLLIDLALLTPAAIKAVRLIRSIQELSFLRETLANLNPISSFGSRYSR